MRVMNGRLHNLVRSPLIKTKYLNDDHYNNSTMQNHVGANHHPTKGFHHRHKRQHRSGKNSNSNDGLTWRRQSTDVVLPRSVQFDESSDSYRCLCGCFHIKTGAMCIAGECGNYLKKLSKSLLTLFALLSILFIQFIKKEFKLKF